MHTFIAVRQSAPKYCSGDHKRLISIYQQSVICETKLDLLRCTRFFNRPACDRLALLS